jgi:hypothetical protein
MVTQNVHYVFTMQLSRPLWSFSFVEVYGDELASGCEVGRNPDTGVTSGILPDKLFNHETLSGVAVIYWN